MGKFLYFGYGSNLFAKRIHVGLPTAERKGVGKLKDYRLDFISYSNRWKGAVATIVPTPGHVIWGAIWELDDKDLPTLDEQESVQQKMYFPLEVDIETLQGNFIKCRTYQQTLTPKLLNEGESLPLDRRPSEMYKDCIVQGAIETGLPNDYIEQLKKIPSVPVKGEMNLSQLLNPN